MIVDGLRVSAHGFHHSPILPKTPAAGTGLTKGPSIMHDHEVGGLPPASADVAQW